MQGGGFGSHLRFKKKKCVLWFKGEAQLLKIQNCLSLYIKLLPFVELAAKPFMNLESIVSH